MASEPGTMPAQPDSNAATTSDQPVVDLVIVSPSVGVPQPLRFPATPASTTIKQLKAKIRDTIPLHPTEENQRLIHRGRALVREADTLLNILGAEAIAADRQHTMHLVIRDAASSAPVPTRQQPVTANPPVSRDPSPAPGNGPQIRGPQSEQYLNMIRGRLLSQANALNQVINQTQRERAQRGMRGIGDTNPQQYVPTDTRDGSPAPSSHSISHEQGPNGRTYRVETTVRTTSTGSSGMSPADLQNFFHNADATQATLTMTNAMNNAMQRSGSSASLHNRPLTHPGVTVPVYPGSVSRAGSGRTTPFGGVSAVPPAQGPPAPPLTGPEVYILSSPEGPRALLVNNSTSDTYYTPRLSTRRSLPRMHNPAFGQMFTEFQRAHPIGHQYQHPSQYTHPQTTDALRQQVPQARDNHAQTSPQPQQVQHRQPPQPLQPQAQAPPAMQQPMGHGLGHPHMHHPVAAIPPLLRMIWPHLWLIFRLALFVWIFTSPGASWSRWMTIIGLAIFIFVLSTGALNGVAEHIMRPVGRHLDNLLPALDGQHGRDGNAPPAPHNAQGLAAARPGGGDHRPEEMAERLLNERRAREGWLTGQFRRVERASLLFLASIAPGVAERHIAHLEAEAARQRREDQEAAARAAAETETQDNEAGTGSVAAQDSPETHANENQRDAQAGQERNEIVPQEQQREQAAAPEPLIAL